MSSVKHCWSLYVLLLLMLLVLLVLPRSAFLETQRFRLPAPPPAGGGASQPARTMEGICVQPLGAQVGEAPRTVGLCVQVAVVGGHAALQQPVLGGSRWPLAFTPLQGRLA